MEQLRDSFSALTANHQPIKSSGKSKEPPLPFDAEAGFAASGLNGVPPTESYVQGRERNAYMGWGNVVANPGQHKVLT